MRTGTLALAGLFALPAALIFSSAQRRRAVRQRLLQLGFEPCDDQEELLQRALLEVAGGLAPSRRRDLREPARFAHRPVSVQMAPGTSRIFESVLRKVIELDPQGAPLEIREAPETASLIAAFAETPGKLDDALPTATQARLARAGAAGFFSVHFSGPRVAFFARPDAEDMGAPLELPRGVAVGPATGSRTRT